MVTLTYAEAVALAAPVQDYFRESRRAGGAVERAGTPRSFPPTSRADAPCRWEGSVVQPCTDPCRGKREANSVRLCLAPIRDGEDDPRCTRGVNNGRDPEIVACASCRYYEKPAT